jgi:hypothetical protein
LRLIALLKSNPSKLRFQQKTGKFFKKENKAMSILKKLQQLTQNILYVPQRVIQYILGAASQIFRPTDDQYPATGVQPFAGEVSNKKKIRHQT